MSFATVDDTDICALLLRGKVTGVREEVIKCLKGAHFGKFVV